MNCPRCKSGFYCKAGFAKCRQRYRCNSCKYYYTVEQRSNIKSAETRRLAFEMYLEGLGFRQIGRVLKISYGTVFHWIKKWGSNIDIPKCSEPIEVVELDELHTYVKEKTTNGYGLL
jgi:transposase-like protein